MYQADNLFHIICIKKISPQKCLSQQLILTATRITVREMCSSEVPTVYTLGNLIRLPCYLIFTLCANTDDWFKLLNAQVNFYNMS